MKKNNIGFFIHLILFVFTLQCEQYSGRNPFEFKQEQGVINDEIPHLKSETLSKWNIKENGDELIVIENIDDGQIRTIEIAPFDH